MPEPGRGWKPRRPLPPRQRQTRLRRQKKKPDKPDKPDKPPKRQGGTYPVFVRPPREGKNSKHNPKLQEQFEFGKEKGDEYWLYVVEGTGDGEPVLHCIQNPVELANKFHFDPSWSILSEGHSA